MSKIAPQVHIETKEGTKYKHFKTYHNHLVPSLGKLFDEYKVDELFVVRSRRGEWGEWCETWKLNHKRKPEIVKEGWS